MTNYASILTIRAPEGRIDTSQLFDANHQHNTNSPVDQFLENTLLLNKHWTNLGSDEEIPSELGRLLLIGYASAVEGYMRSLISGLVCVDPFTKEKCSAYQVPFAAALHHTSELLPEALLEETSFSTENVISNTLTKFVDVTIVNNSTKLLLEDFNLLMQLRHCCTHRFGKLGIKNATILGLSLHSPLLEKPVKLDKAAMSKIADLIFTLVKSINNEVFELVMKRSATKKLGSNSFPGIGWSWNIARDRTTFNRYYKVFRSEKDATPSPPAEQVYRGFRDEFRLVGKSKKS